MRLLKTNVILRLLNSYLVDSPQPTNISYLWNFGSLLAICLIIQILTGAFLAMHVRPFILILPVILITMTELMSCKPTDLPEIEMRRELEHVGKVLKGTNYMFLKGEVIFIYVLLIHPSQDAKLISKIVVTRL
jgi:hypothetical protein